MSCCHFAWPRSKPLLRYEGCHVHFIISCQFHSAIQGNTYAVGLQKFLPITLAERQGSSHNKDMLAARYAPNPWSLAPAVQHSHSSPISLSYRRVYPACRRTNRSPTRDHEGLAEGQPSEFAQLAEGQLSKLAAAPT